MVETREKPCGKAPFFPLLFIIIMVPRHEPRRKGRLEKEKEKSPIYLGNYMYMTTTVLHARSIETGRIKKRGLDGRRGLATFIDSLIH